MEIRLIGRDGFTDVGLGFGRNSQTLPPRDVRDENFRMESILRTGPTIRPYKYHYTGGWWGDQGSTSQCVAYAGLHFLEDGPITVKHAAPPILQPLALYKDCQRNDEWPGEDYDGTSIRALMRVLKRDNHIGEYRWAWDLGTAVRWLYHRSPLVMGTWWHMSMFYPDAKGLVKIHGGKVGGHAWLANGISIPRGWTLERAIAERRGRIRGKNSWGREWGWNGHFYIEMHDFENLILDHGECATAPQTSELRKAA